MVVVEMNPNPGGVKMARTTRVPNRTVSPGAVNQTGGTLPLYRCNTCKADVVWAESKRTGRRYLANVSSGYHGQLFYVGANVHDCAPRLAEAEAQANTAKLVALNERYVLAIQEADRAGDTAERDRLLVEWTEATAAGVPS